MIGILKGWSRLHQWQLLGVTSVSPESLYPSLPQQWNVPRDYTIEPEAVLNLRSSIPKLIGKCQYFETSYKITAFLNVLGVVDGTHIKIQRPINNEADFVNGKGFHSLNIQMVCDARFRITDLIAKWPGSVHDSRMFTKGTLCADFMEDSTHPSAEPEFL